MTRASRILVVCGAIAAALSPSGRADGPAEGVPVRPVRFQPGRSARGFAVRWVGQDGHDYVSASDHHEPDERQDTHLALVGLNPRREIRFIDITLPNGHRWQYNPLPGYWHAHLIRREGATTGDVWVEAVELPAGTVYHVLVKYDDDSTVEAEVRSRKVNPNLRVPSASVQARWVGQGKQDWTGVGMAVGPDGLQDVRVHLENLSAKFPVKSIRVEASGGLRWESGQNPQFLANAEFIKDAKDPRQGDLFFQPERDLAGQRLRLTISYEGSSADGVVVAAGRIDPKLRMPLAPLPRVEEVAITARWAGQDGGNPSRPGAVHVVLGGLPASGRIVAIELTDTVREAWLARLDDRITAHLSGQPGSLDVRFHPDQRSADLFFSPYRETSHETFSVRLVGADGRSWHGRFPGGACDLARLAPAPTASRAEARPGDDLQALLDRNGIVVLAGGTYRLRRPLVIDRPTRLTGSGGATLLFAQEAGDAPWGSAIKVRSSNTTLEGFAVRFAGPIRWDPNVSYGAAVIGMTQHTEPGYNDLKSQVVFRDLDVESPPVEDPGKWVESPRLFRLVGASSGAIVHCRLRGGPIEFFHGPWQFVDNEFRGTPPGTFSHGFLAGHFTHDLLIRGNRLSSPPPSGKTWRFLVLTGSSVFDRVENNIVEGVGARDDDTIPWGNEPEIILTENYAVRYEGKVLAVSDDGRVIQIGQRQGFPVQPGDAVAILEGTPAGQWRRVSHVLDPVTFLLDEPIPKGAEAVSISQAFVSETFEGNRIDIRGGRRSDSFVLAGNHYGTRVVGNHLLGGGLAWRLLSCPTGDPMSWGWSHAPYFGGLIARNILEDTERGGELGVEHSPAIKTNKGRTYMSVQLVDNLVRWTAPFLAARRRSAGQEPLSGLTLGYPHAADPSELIVTGSGNGLDAPAAYRDAPAMVVNAARFNGQKVVGRKYRLPAHRAVGEATAGGTRPRR